VIRSNDMRKKAPWAKTSSVGFGKDWLLYDYEQKGPYLIAFCSEEDYEVARSAVRTLYSRVEAVPKERVGARRLRHVKETR